MQQFSNEIMKMKPKKLFKLETYENVLVGVLHFFMYRNPLFLYFWFKYYLFDGAFREKEENRKLFLDKYKTFNQRHPFVSAGTSIMLIFLILISFSWIVFLRSSKPAAAWWNDVWGYRKAIQITNSSGSDLTDFQVKVLDDEDLSSDISAGKIQSDLDDLRFTDLNGNSLSYWIEDSTETSVDVWVKPENIYTSGTTVYMYYGNSSATSLSNKSNVMVADNATGFKSPVPKGTLSNDDRTWSAGTGYSSVVLDKTFSGQYFEMITYWAHNYRGVGMVYGSSVSHDDWTGWSNNPTGPYWGALNVSGFPSGYIGTYFGQYHSPISGEGAATIGYWFKQTRSGNVLSLQYSTVSASGPWLDIKSAISISSSDKVAIGLGEASSTEITPLSIQSLYYSQSVSVAPVVGSPGTEEKSKGPVGYWSFDEGYGTTVNDGSGNENNGTLTSGPSWKSESECVSGKCLEFDGTDDYVTVSQSSEINMIANEPFSISYWVKVPDTEWYCVLSKGNYNTGYSHYMNGNKLYVYTDSDSSAELTTSGDIYNANEWTHITQTYDGDKIRVYSNGVLKSTSGSGITSVVNTNALTLGKDMVPYRLKGDLDEPKIYNYARTADEIKQDYNTGLAGMGGGQDSSAAIGSDSPAWMSDGLVGYWKMDEASWDGTSGEVDDASGNGLHGTRISNATTAAGKFGNGGTFAGGTDAVTLNATHTFGNGNWTASTWVKTNSDGAIISNNSGGPVTNDLRIYGGKIAYSSYYTSWQTNAGNVSVNDGSWHLLTWVNFDDQTMDLYVDGELDVGGFSSVTNNGGPVNSIGRDWSASFNGLIDDTRIYNRALSPQEIKDLYSWAPGPVGHWRMDEKSGTTAYDSSGNGNNGALVNGPTWAQGEYGGGVELSGDNYIDIPESTNLNSTGTISIEGWVYYKENTDGQPAFIYDYHNTQGWYSLFRSGDTSSPLIEFDFVGGPVCKSTVPLVLNEWSHIAFTYDKQNMRLYINGKNVKTVAYTGTPSYGTGSITVGKASHADVQYLKGLIDDVRIYNYARTEKQIVENMNAGHPVGGSPVGSQVSYWKFDEGFGTTVHDSITSSGNDGTISGASWTNDGKFGKALEFDGSGDYVNAGSDSSMDLEEDYTLSMWVYNDAGSNSYPTLFNKAVQSASNGFFWTYTSGTDEADINFQWSDGSDYHAEGFSSALDKDTWNYVLFRFVNSTKALELFVDGKKVGATKTLTNYLPVDDGDLYIGTYSGSSSTYVFDGKIDEFKIYNSALTEEEIQKDYNQGKSLVMGSKGTASDGVTPSDAASREYCVPGDTSTCDPPIGEWKFDEKTGTTANDTSGNNYSMTFGATPTWTRGKKGSAIDFDPDDYVSHNWADFSLGPQTIEFWMKADTVSAGWRDLVGTTLNSDVNRFHLYTSNNSIVWYSVLGACGTLNSGIIPVAGQWYHVAGTTDGSNARMYINGKEENSTSCTTASYTSTGMQVGGYTEDFDGQIDDVRVYDYARTGAQIAYDYDRGKPIGHWKMDEGEGTTVHDESGNGNDGTLAEANWDDGVSGKSTRIDSSYLSLPISAKAPMNTTLWFKAATNTDDILASSNAPLFYWYQDGTDYIHFSLYSYGGSPPGVPYLQPRGYVTHYYHQAYNFLADQWYFAVFRITADRMYLDIYKDGVLVDSRTENVNSGYASYNFTALRLYDFGSECNYDDVRVYNYDLTSEQIKQIMNNGAVNYR